jgi:hypothetical protein
MSCFGQNPSAQWFTTEHRAGYDMAIMDPDAWTSEFPDGNSDDPGTAAQCRLAANSLNQLREAVDAGMKVGLYNRNPLCYLQTISALKGHAHIKSGTPIYIWDIETSPGILPTKAEIAKVTAWNFLNGAYTWQGAVPGTGTQFGNLPLHYNEVNNWNTPNAPAPTTVDGNPYPEINAIPHFDGWTSADMEQQSTGTLNGERVDFDSVNTAWLAGLR